MSADHEIREQIARYIAGGISAAELEDWLEDATWDDDGRTAPLAASTLRLLAEHGNGDWTDAELVESLGTLTRSYWFQQAPKVAWSGSAATVTVHQPSPSADRRHVAASG